MKLADAHLALLVVGAALDQNCFGLRLPKEADSHRHVAWIDGEVFLLDFFLLGEQGIFGSLQLVVCSLNHLTLCLQALKPLLLLTQLRPSLFLVK